jgi:SnoaL-like domain
LSLDSAVADRVAISSVVAALAFAQDDQDWERLRSLFTPEVHLDLSRVFGEPPVEITAAELAGQARGVIGGFESTHHATSNAAVTVDGDEARCRAHVVAYHHLPAEDGRIDHCTMRGYWSLGLRRDGDRWLIARWAVVRTAPWEGDPGLYQVAAARSR